MWLMEKHIVVINYTLIDLYNYLFICCSYYFVESIVDAEML